MRWLVKLAGGVAWIDKHGNGRCDRYAWCHWSPAERRTICVLEVDDD